MNPVTHSELNAKLKRYRRTLDIELGANVKLDGLGELAAKVTGSQDERNTLRKELLTAAEDARRNGNPAYADSIDRALTTIDHDWRHFIEGNERRRAYATALTAAATASSTWGLSPETPTQRSDGLAVVHELADFPGTHSEALHE